MDVQLSTLQNSVTPSQPSTQAKAVSREVTKAGKDLPVNGNNGPEKSKPKPKPKPQDLQKAVQQIQDFLSSSKRQLQFRIDDLSGRTVITVINPKSGEIVRQIPDEEVLRLAATMRQQGPHFINESA